MAIVSLGGSEYETTIDVNDGQATQTFTQSVDAEYDITLDSEPSHQSINFDIPSNLSTSMDSTNQILVDIGTIPSTDVNVDLDVSFHSGINNQGGGFNARLHVGDTIVADKSISPDQNYTLSFSGTVTTTRGSVHLSTNGKIGQIQWNTFDVQFPITSSTSINSISKQ